MELTNQMHPSSCWHYFPRVSRVGPGLLVFRAATAQDTPKEDILDHNWPTMEDANARQNSFRASVYDINQMYSRSNDRIGSVQLNVKNTASHLLTLCQKELRVPISTVHDDFYSHGGRDGNLFALRLAKRAFSGFDCPVHGRDCLARQQGPEQMRADRSCGAGQDLRALVDVRRWTALYGFSSSG